MPKVWSLYPVTIQSDFEDRFLETKLVIYMEEHRSYELKLSSCEKKA